MTSISPSTPITVLIEPSAHKLWGDHCIQVRMCVYMRASTSYIQRLLGLCKLSYKHTVTSSSKLCWQWLPALHCWHNMRRVNPSVSVCSHLAATRPHLLDRHLLMSRAPGSQW